MFLSLSPGAIGASVENLADGVDLAVRHGLALAKLRPWTRKRLSRWLGARGVRLICDGLCA